MQTNGLAIHGMRFCWYRWRMRIGWLGRVLLWLLILYMIVDGSVRTFQKKSRDNAPRPALPRGLPHTYTNRLRASVTRMLFLGYSRGGSSISSEIFDIDDRAIFWYEPLDAFYFSQTGYYGRKDQKVLMNHNESDFRYIEPWEVDGMSQFFRDLFDCKLSRLPTEFQVHRFIKHNSALEDYASCYDKQSSDGITHDLDTCRDMIQDVCGKTVDRAVENQCLEVMRVMHNTIPGKIDPEDVKSKLHKAGLRRGHIDSILGNLIDYKKCLDKLERIADSCIHVAEESCRSKTLRTAKVVRLTLDVAKAIMPVIPDLLITIFIRDPRAIAYSRAGTAKTEFDILNALRLSCRKMKADIDAAVDIARHYPGSVQVLRYEDFVEDPYHWAGEMYRHAGYTTPPKMDEFIQTHMFAGETDGKKWGNIRPNATEIAYKWHQMVSLELVEKMQAMCGDLIARLGYTVY